MFPSLLGQVALPSTGIDMAGFLTALITDYGAVVAVIVGGSVAFGLIWMALRKKSKVAH